MNEIETNKKQYKELMKQKPFFGKINNPGESLAKLTKRKKPETQIKLEIKRRHHNKHGGEVRRLRDIIKICIPRTRKSKRNG